MALHWDLRDCKVPSEELWSEDEKGITDNLIWMCMAVGMSGITEGNWKEFLFRLRVLEGLDGPILYKFIPTTDPPEAGKGRNEPMYYTVEMIKKRIGLRTNVSNETRPAWLKRTTKYTFDKILKGIEDEEEKEAKKLRIVK